MSVVATFVERAVEPDYLYDLVVQILTPSKFTEQDLVLQADEDPFKTMFSGLKAAARERAAAVKQQAQQAKMHDRHHRRVNSAQLVLDGITMREKSTGDPASSSTIGVPAKARGPAQPADAGTRESNTPSPRSRRRTLHEVETKVFGMAREAQAWVRRWPRYFRRFLRTARQLNELLYEHQFGSTEVGPFDLKNYTDERLEEPLWNLLETVFQLSKRAGPILVLVDGSRFMFNNLFGSLINRCANRSY